MSTRRVSWSLLMFAALCVLPVLLGIDLVRAGTETSEIAGWALIGFFGSGVAVLTHKALFRGTAAS